MSLSGDKGVAQFKKSVKMEHPNQNAKCHHRNEANYDESTVNSHNS